MIHLVCRDCDSCSKGGYDHTQNLPTPSPPHPLTNTLLINPAPPQEATEGTSCSVLRDKHYL